VIQAEVDGKEVLDPGKGSSVLSTVLRTINNKSEYVCQIEVVWLINALVIGNWNVDPVPSNNFLISAE